MPPRFTMLLRVSRRSTTITSCCALTIARLLQRAMMARYARAMRYMRLLRYAAARYLLLLLRAALR